MYGNHPIVENIVISLQLYVYGNHHIVENIVILCKKSYLCLLGNYVGLERRDCVLNLIVCFSLGVKEVGDIVEILAQRILEFVEARQLLRILPNYGFIWQQLQNIALVQGSLSLQQKHNYG